LKWLEKLGKKPRGRARADQERWTCPLGCQHENGRRARKICPTLRDATERREPQGPRVPHRWTSTLIPVPSRSALRSSETPNEVSSRSFAPVVARKPAPVSDWTSLRTGAASCATK